MCRQCLREPCPDRHTTTFDTGAYLLNYAGCAQCKLYAFPVEVNRHESQEGAGHSDWSDDDREHDENSVTGEGVPSNGAFPDDQNQGKQHAANKPTCEETVTFEHHCTSCGHCVARHEYTFTVLNGRQEYTMNCMLCGHGEASVSVLPDDPRNQAAIIAPPVLD